MSVVICQTNLNIVVPSLALWVSLLSDSNTEQTANTYKLTLASEL